jgi:hypothetical protein
MSSTSTNTKRFSQWNLKYDPKAIEAMTTAGKATYAANAQTKFNEQYAIELRVKQVIDGLGLPVTHIAPLLAFAMELWSSTGKYHGETLAIEAQVLVDKWVARGMVQSALEKIRKDVFDVNPPVAP